MDQNIQNKKGGMSFNLIMIIVLLIGGTMVFIMADQILQNEFLPAIENTIPDDSLNKAEIENDNQKLLDYWIMFPLVLFIVLIINFITSAVTSNRQNGQ